MSQYVKRQWPRILGFAAPLFALVVLIGFGLSIFPNSNTYGLPGDSCNSNNFDNCDPCNGEICILSAGMCANAPSGTNNFDPNITAPQCPDLTGTNPAPTPDCYDICNPTTSNGVDGFGFECLPNDQVCQDISGGNVSSDCRIGTCTDDPVRDTLNPSGCDYDYDGREVDPCINCEDAVEAGFDNCGNGVCEVDEGEDCQTCPDDCLVPGFDGLCPETTAAACGIFIVFPGPPYNGVSEPVEDGDICTNDSCVQPLDGSIESTDKSCMQDQLDFCCPAGCMAPPDGLTCAEADAQGILPRVECDADCYIPEMCFIPPPPPPPPPPPGNTPQVEGSGEVFGCSVQGENGMVHSRGLDTWLFLGLGLSGFLLISRRRLNS